jgi:glycosyltransferase involved in cell wall biosynthesis
MNFEHCYSREVRDTQVGILGIIPPPFGGVSVHVRRVADQLHYQNNRVYFFNIEQSRKFLPFYLIKLICWLIWNRPKILYFHGTYSRGCWADLFIICVLKRFIKYEVTIVEHDCRHLYKRSNLFKRFYRWALKRIDHVVLIGKQAYKSYEDNQIELDSYSIEGAFLPPVVSMANMVEQSYPSSLFIFLKSFTPILLMNAAHIMTIDGRDIYGFDLACDMIAGIKEKYPDVGLVIGLAQVDDEPYKLLCDRMKRLDIAEHVYIVRDQKEFWPLFKRVDIFIRPTRSDGASISLQEALYFKVPAIASDAVTRPDGVITFRSNNSADFINVVDQTLQHKVYGNAHEQRDTVHP